MQDQQQMINPTISMSQLGSMSKSGNGSSLLILHGLLGAARNWGAIVKDLSQDYQVFTLDLPNHGGSDWTHSMDYPSQAQIIAHWLQDHGAPMHVLGHSMGGKIAMTIALTQPELITDLIVADTAPVAYDHDFTVLLNAMKAVPLAEITKRADVEAHLAQNLPDPRIRAFLMQNLASTEAGFRWRSNLDLMLASQPEILGFPDFPPSTHFDGRTLFLHGALSDYVRPQYESTIRQRFPNVQFNALANAGHWLHADQPAAFIAAVRGFLAI